MEPAAPQPEQPPTTTPTADASIPETVQPTPEAIVPEATAPAPAPLPVEEVSVPEASTLTPTPIVGAVESEPALTPTEVPEPAPIPPSIPDPAATLESAQSTSTPATPLVPAHLGGSTEEMRILTHIAAAARKRQAEEHIEQVMDMARKNGKVDNVTIRLALRVSRTSATRYLSELVRQGHLTHHREGNNVVYEVKG